MQPNEVETVDHPPTYEETIEELNVQQQPQDLQNIQPEQEMMAEQDQVKLQVLAEIEPEKVEIEPEKVEIEPEKVEIEPEKVEIELEVEEIEPEKAKIDPETVEIEIETVAIQPKKVEFEPGKIIEEDENDHNNNEEVAEKPALLHADDDDVVMMPPVEVCSLQNRDIYFLVHNILPSSDNIGKRACVQTYGI